MVCAAACSLLSPAAEPAPSGLPTPDAVLQQVMKQALKDEAGEREFARTYSYTRTRVTENRDAKGGLQNREEKRDVRKPAAPTVPPALVTTASPSRSAKGGERLTAPKPATTVPSGKAFDRSDFILNGDLLHRFDMKVTGREMINGRQTLVLEFRPASKQPSPKNIKDRFINKAAGHLWIDEEESILARAELRLTAPVDVVGGLVASISAFQYQFDRERTNEGFWFTRKTAWHLEGREVVVRKNIDYKEEKSDLRKVPAPNQAAISAGS